MFKLSGKKKIRDGLADIKNLPFPEVNFSWPKSWRSLENEEELRKRIQVELNAEIGPKHPLWGFKPVAFAKRNSSDDILVHLKDGRFALVHLVWHGPIDQQSDKFPSTGFLTNDVELQKFLDDEK
jgi:hypothetical protein